MLENYLKITLRNFARNKTYSFITIIGRHNKKRSGTLQACKVFGDLALDWFRGAPYSLAFFFVRVT